MIFPFIKDHTSEFRVEKMAKVFGVSRNRYYHFLKKGQSQKQKRDLVLLQKIKAIYEQSRETYGSPRVQAELKAQGEKVSRKRVACLMKKENLVAKKRKRFKCTTKVNPKLPVAANILQQDFKAERPNQKWVSDITYVWTSFGWLYIAAILDLFSRKIVGLSMGQRMTKSLVTNAFLQAVQRRGKPQDLTYHSDRGSQYTSYEFQSLLKDYGVTASMSGTGNCYDNAAMESFFATLKTECVYFENYETPQEAQRSIFEYCEIFYNNQRRHSTLGYLSPRVFEEQAFLRENSVH